jgi:hypothetical protein
MRRSVNEIQVLVLKAARGAGVPLANAEDLANAVAGSIHTRPDVLREVLGTLRGPLVAASLTDGTTLNGSFALTGPAAIDLLLAGENAVTIKPAPPGNLLAALVKDANRTHGVSLVISKAPSTATLEFSMSDAPPSKRPTGPVDVEDDIWSRLSALAAKTYVPASVASRSLGAGANLDDND